jgi:hypothetical protein
VGVGGQGTPAQARGGSLRLIRFRGHLPKGGYDVQNDGRDSQAPAAPAIR